jgi:hypothetical protein
MPWTIPFAGTRPVPRLYTLSADGALGQVDGLVAVIFAYPHASFIRNLHHIVGRNKVK